MSAPKKVSRSKPAAKSAAKSAPDLMLETARACRTVTGGLPDPVPGHEVEARKILRTALTRIVFLHRSLGRVATAVTHYDDTWDGGAARTAFAETLSELSSVEQQVCEASGHLERAGHWTDEEARS